MWVNRTSLRIAVGVLASFLVTSTAFGEDNLQGAEPFAPADLSTFGGPIEPNEGFFFQYDLMYWSISAPNTQLVGSNVPRTVNYGPHPLTPTDQIDDTRQEVSTLTTSDLSNDFTVGNRLEFGNIEDRNGWLMSIYQLRNQGDVFMYGQADVVFKDLPQGPNGTTLLNGPVPGALPANPTRPLPVTLYNIMMITQVSTWGVEANYLHRALTCHGGGTLEFFGGARYFEFNDQFGIQAGDDPGGHTVPSFLADSSWYTTAQNHVIGPQVGARWFKKQGRWTLSTEGRFMAGLNYQNFHQAVNMGPNLNPGGTSGSAAFTPSTMGPTWATHDAFTTEFTPAVELRLEGRYQLTRAISFHAGWTGFWMDNIARANAVINYQVPAMGIDLSNNKQNLLLNGVTIGFDINR